MIEYDEIVRCFCEIQRAAEAIHVWVPNDVEDMTEEDNDTAHWFYATAAANMGYSDEDFMTWALQYVHANESTLIDNDLPIAVAVMMQRSFAMGIMLGRSNPI